MAHGVEIPHGRFVDVALLNSLRRRFLPCNPERQGRARKLALASASR